jgi:hypothetical protein
MIILQDDKGLKNHGMGLVDGKLSDGRPFIPIHQEDVLADPPSQDTRLLLDAWFELQNSKTDENGDARLSSTRSST